MITTISIIVLNDVVLSLALGNPRSVEEDLLLAHATIEQKLYKNTFTIK